MSKNTGSDSGISENIELNLETNFESVLTRTTALYTNFQKRVGSVSQSLVTNVNSMYKQVSTNLTAMTADVQNNTIRSINATRTGMRKIVDESMKASIDVKKNLDAMSQFRGMAGRVAATGDEKKIAAFNTFMDKKAAKLEQQAYLELGKAAAGASETIKQASMDSLNSIEKLTTGTHKSFYKLRKDLWKNGDIVSALRAKDGVIELENQLKVAEKTLLQQGKRVTAAEKEVQNARLALTKQTNNKLREGQEQFLQQTIVNLNKVQQEYAASERKVARLRGVFTAGKKAVASDIVGLVSNQKSAIVPNAAESIAELNAIKAKFAEMAETYNKLSKTRFLNRTSVEEFKNDATKMEGRVNKYKEAIEKLKESIRGLEILHKKGLAPGSGAEIENYKTRLREMEAGLRNISTSSRKTINESENLVKKQTKSVALSTWEMIRNFRWQVAAFVYLANKAVMTVKNTFFKVIDDLQKFRTDSLAIAASISYSMLGSVSENFNKAFIYSKDLMTKLEMEAAKTILTLEDMTMLTKTFVQAGMIPQGDEDIKKISTIGTAIKILTEGMANAGVQMRQELYALIQGRQRATDQVATMFGMLGINIQKTLDTAKKEGKDLIDVLAEALEPFSEVNKEMAHDYSVQLEALDKIWSKIKRLGADNTYKEVSKSIENINSALLGTDNNLTKLGRNGAAALNMLMESVRIVTKGFSNMFEGLISGITSSKLAITYYSEIIRIFGLLAIIADLAATSINRLTKVAFGGVAKEGAKIGRTLQKEGIVAALKEFKELISGDDSALGGWFERSGDLAVDIENSLKSLNKIFDETKNKVPKLDLFKLTNPEAIEELGKIRGKLKEASLSALSGAARARKEFELDFEAVQDTKAKFEKSLLELNTALTKTTDKKKKEGILNSIAENKKALKDIHEYELNLAKERDRKISEASDKGNKKEISYFKEYEMMLESLEEAAQTPLEQVFSKYEKKSIEIFAFIKEHAKKLTDEQKKSIWDKFFKENSDSVDRVFEEMQQSYQSFFDSMSSHRVLSPLEAIDNEFKKIANNIEKSNLNDVMKQDLLNIIPIFQKEREELELITLELQKQELLYRNREIKADILDLSVSPMDKQQASLAKLTNKYKQDVSKIKADMAEIEKKSKSATDIREIANFSIQLKLHEQYLEDLRILYERNKEDVMEPFWKDLEDLSQGWADSLADTLTEVMWNMDSFEDAFKSFLEAILQDIVRSGIKRAITDNLLNMIPAIGNYFSGGSGVGASAAASTGTAYGAGALNYMGTGYGTGPFIGMAGGGVINEPVIGRGLRSGTSYAFGEGGASEVVLPLDKLKGNSSPSANVVVNVINQSGERMAATQQGKPRFDGEKFVVDVILRKMSTDPAFRSAMGRR